MKCVKCKTELFSKDIVDRIENFEFVGISPLDGFRHIIEAEIYRCPKCFKVKKVKCK